MEIYRTKDNTVTKYVHDDGSETAIKTTSCTDSGTSIGTVDNKYNVFISYSVGCVVGCKFCYLTSKKCPYTNLRARDIYENVKKALDDWITNNPEAKNMYTKISWMGMGDGFFDLRKIYVVTLFLAEYLKENNLSAGIDGVDIATSLPIIPEDVVDFIELLSIEVNKFNLNPKRNYSELRSPLRVFYSLHSADNDIRNSLIPITISVEEASKYLKTLTDRKITVIVHQMLFEGINDSLKDAKNILKFMDTLNDDLLYPLELRLLRFNKCPNTIFTESTNFDYLVKFFNENYSNVKVQFSAGSEVHAACGQFLLSKILK